MITSTAGNDKTPHTRGLISLHLLTSIIVFAFLFWLSYPYYRFYIDPDAVAYLTMAKRAAEGDWMRLVNALWSPLHPAMVALCVRGGMDAVLAMHLTNGLACGLIIAACYFLFRRFSVERFLGFALLKALAIFLVYALYKQTFCDLWQVMLLLAYLLLVTRRDFLQKPLLWLVCGIIAVLAAYAKTYSFYFLLLHLPVTLWLLRRVDSQQRFPWKPLVLILGIQLLLLAPWVGLMHKKYGVWAFSKSGALNTSWTLAGNKTLRPEIGTLIPPPYLNSPYTWEDPYLAEGKLHGRFENFGMMKSQVGHSIQAALQGAEAAGQISHALLPVLATSLLLILFRKKKNALFNPQHKIMLAAALIMPLGYLLLHFEARYIWLLLPVGMVLGAGWLAAFHNRIGNERAYKIACILFALSFIAYPLSDAKALFRKGEDAYQLAATLNGMNIRGSFTSNDNPNRAGCVAFWLGCNYYTPASERLTFDKAMPDMRRYNVNFYFHHQNALDITDVVLRDEAGRPMRRLDGGRIPGMQVFMVNP